MCTDQHTEICGMDLDSTVGEVSKNHVSNGFLTLDISAFFYSFIKTLDAPLYEDQYCNAYSPQVT